MKTVLVLLFISFNIFAQDCKPEESYTDKLTDRECEYYGGKLETIRGIFNQLTYKNYMYFSYDEDEKKPYLALRILLNVDAPYAHLLDQGFEKDSKIGIKAGKEVFWFKIGKIQKSQYIASSNLYTTYFLNAYTDFETLAKIQKEGMVAYQFTNTYNETIQGDINSSKSSSISKQIGCFITKYKK
jgi:hypothetical protein